MADNAKEGGCKGAAVVQMSQKSAFGQLRESRKLFDSPNVTLMQGTRRDFHSIISDVP